MRESLEEADTGRMSDECSSPIGSLPTLKGIKFRLAIWKRMMETTMLFPSTSAAFMVYAHNSRIEDDVEWLIAEVERLQKEK